MKLKINEKVVIIMKNVPIKSKRIAIALVRAGFDFVNVVDDKDNPRFKVFMFEQSEEFFKALKSIQQ